MKRADWRFELVRGFDYASDADLRIRRVGERHGGLRRNQATIAGAAPSARLEPRTSASRRVGSDLRKVGRRDNACGRPGCSSYFVVAAKGGNPFLTPILILCSRGR